AGLETVPRDLFDFLPTRLRHGDSRHGNSETKRRALHGPGRIERGRRTNSSRFVRYRLSPAYPKLGAHAAEERRLIRGHALDDGELQRRSDCNPLSARGGHGRETEG